MIPTTRQRGLSLVELMVAMAIGLMVLAAMSQAFVNTSATRAELDRTGRQVENGRYAIHLLGTDLKLAGYYGEFAGSGLSVSVPPDVCAAGSLAALGWSGAAYPVHVTGFTDASPTCVSDRKAGTDVIVVRRVGTEPTTVAGAAGSAASYFLQTSGCADEPLAPIVARGNAGAATFVRTRKDCATVSELRPFVARIYYVASTGTDAVPLLRRRELQGDAWTTTDMVDGIEDMRFEYAVDTDGDGAPEQSGLTASSVAADCAASAGVCWENVVSATVHLLARNTERSPGHMDDKRYQMGATSLGPFSDGYKRHVYSVTVPFVNPAGRRE